MRGSSYRRGPVSSSGRPDSGFRRNDDSGCRGEPCVRPGTRAV
ncbi:hypothetical protein [Microbulbifer halophilus]